MRSRGAGQRCSIKSTVPSCGRNAATVLGWVRVGEHAPSVMSIDGGGRT